MQEAKFTSRELSLRIKEAEFETNNTEFCWIPAKLDQPVLRSEAVLKYDSPVPAYQIHELLNILPRVKRGVERTPYYLVMEAFTSRWICSYEREDTTIACLEDLMKLPDSQDKKTTFIADAEHLVQALGDLLLVMAQKGVLDFEREEQ